MGRLGIDILSVNAFTDEHRPVLKPEDYQALFEDLKDHVRNSGSDLGVLLEPGGGSTTLVDEGGREVDQEHVLMMFIEHEAARGAETVAIPVSCSSKCEEVAFAAGADVKWTATSLTSLMARAGRPEIGFAGNAEGAIIFPKFLQAPDALMTFAKALELVATAGGLWERSWMACRTYTFAKAGGSNPVEPEGGGMRHVASVATPGRLVLLDGVKIVEEDRWALVIPAPDEPLTRIWAEGPTEADADALAERYATVVAEVVAEGADQ